MVYSILFFSIKKFDCLSVSKDLAVVSTKTIQFSISGNSMNDFTYIISKSRIHLIRLGRQWGGEGSHCTAYNSMKGFEIKTKDHTLRSKHVLTFVLEPELGHSAFHYPRLGNIISLFNKI